jgi:hypothetical protein
MKTEDKDIKIGSSVNNRIWAKHIVQLIPDTLDFVTLSHYTNFNDGYSEYLKKSPLRLNAKGMMLQEVMDAKQIPKSVPIIVTEFNSASWKGNWRQNDWGHTLVMMQTAMDLLYIPRLTQLGLWTSRWMDLGEPLTFANALDHWNGLKPIGQGYSIITKAFLPNMHQPYNDDQVVIYPMSDINNTHLLILNRTGMKSELEIKLSSNAKCYEGIHLSTTPPSPNSVNPAISSKINLQQTLSVNPYSVGILYCER